MSDAMTNREIEDVLTSIRRLVAQDGGRALDRDGDRDGEPVRDAAAFGGVPAGSRTPGRLILTNAQRVDPAASAESADGGTVGVAPGVSNSNDLPAPDFVRLEATIAELEAAVSASGGSWEADSTDDQPRASNVTDLYERLAFAPRREAAAPPASGNPIRTEPGPAALDEPTPARAADVTPEVEDVAGGVKDAAAAVADVAPGAEPAAADEATADEIFRLPPVPGPLPETESGETILDEAGLQALVAQIVRDELQGQLGERITAQVRKLVRSEIAKALNERKFL